MATYYIRKTGSDAAAGTSPATAWLTIGKALGASGIASGDTVYVGTGVYRETVSVAMTSAVAETKIIGDVDGSQTGDAGEVQWTAYTTSDIVAPSGTTLLNLAGRDFLTFQSIKFIGGAATLITATTSVSTNVKFSKCGFVVGSTGTNVLIAYTTAANTAANWTIDQCVFVRGNGIAINLTLTRPATADFDYNIIVKNCTFIGGNSGSVFISAVGANTFNGGGVIIYNCTQIGTGALMTTNSANLSTSIPCKVYNSLVCSGVGSTLSANTTGQIVEDYNILIAAATPRTNVTAGTHSISDGSYAPLFFTGIELINQGIRRPFGMPSPSSSLLGFGNQAGSPATDILGDTRPGTPGVGAYETKTFNTTVIY